MVGRAPTSTTVRSGEVTANGPKSWSLAAALHPDIAAKYEAVQHRAATEIIGWLAQTGGRAQRAGGVPVENSEAASALPAT